MVTQIWYISPRLSEMEQQAAVAFQLKDIVGQVCVQYRGYFSKKHRTGNRQSKSSIVEHKKARNAVNPVLVSKIERLNGAPIALAKLNNGVNREEGNLRARLRMRK